MRKSNKRWSAEEDTIVKLEYPRCSSCNELLKMLPNRTWKNIVVRAWKLKAMRRAPVGRSQGTTNPLATGQGKISGSYISRLRSGANGSKGRILEYPLLDGSDDSYAYLNGIITERCPLSGHLLTFSVFSGDTSGTASLDRIDSSKGYIKGNVRWIHKTVNKMRRDMDDVTFITLISDVYQYSCHV